MMSPRQRRGPGLRRQALVAVGQVIRDPRHDGAKEEGQTEDTFRDQ